MPDHYALYISIDCRKEDNNNITSKNFQTAKGTSIQVLVKMTA